MNSLWFRGFAGQRNVGFLYELIVKEYLSNPTWLRQALISLFSVIHFAHPSNFVHQEDAADHGTSHVPSCYLQCVFWSHKHKARREERTEDDVTDDHGRD
jgi:hypothetical protein